MNLPLLYIDPGTGSALFSILIGAAATLYFLCRAFIIKLKVIFSGGKTTEDTSLLHPFVIYCEGKQYWNVFKPVLDEFENRETGILYLTSAENDPVFDISWRFVKAEFIGEGNRAFARLNILRAGICLMTTPGLNVYQLKRSKMTAHYSHVLHATTDATTYRLFCLDYFDSVLLTGDYQAADIRLLEKMRGLPEKRLITTGCTYLDLYSKKIGQIPGEDEHPFTVLVSPSWGASALLSHYGNKLLDPLCECGWRIIIRPHPQSKKTEAVMLDKLQSRYKNSDNIEWDFENENIFVMKKADIMISDFSGIIFDYMFLCDRPVLYVNQDFDLRPYDADDIDHEPWQLSIIKEAGIELKEEDFPHIVEIIKNAKDSESLSTARRKAREIAWQYPGEAGKRIFDFMHNIVNNV
jgi:hypothetical protein